jgi:hypothetical protein
VKEAVRLFSGAFEQTNALKVIDGFVVNCLTHALTAAEVTVVLEEEERLLRLFFPITATVQGAVEGITFRDFPEWLKGKLGEYKSGLTIRASTGE